MRRFNALLIAAGLAAAPASATAGSCPRETDHSFWTTIQATAGKGRLGAYVLALTPELRKHFGVPEDRGVMVARVEPRSPAAMAGIQPGDVVTEVRGRSIADAGDVVAALADLPNDQTASVKLVRDGKTLDLTARITADPRSWFSWLHDLFEPFAQHRTT